MTFRAMISRRSFMGGSVSAGALYALGARATGYDAARPGPIVETHYGRIRGLSALDVISFRGIPYGGACDGVHRFHPPSAPTAWTGVRDATVAGPRAMQPDGNVIFEVPVIGPYFSGGRSDAAAITKEERSENCLALNVLTPSMRGKRPVMVYIHGGGYFSGSGALTLLSDRLVREEDIVLVGVNHRLNAFGYTYLGAFDDRYADSGNAGQLDLVLALKWVQSHIASFGGDPNNVTIFGESGGGGKVSTLLAMPNAKGLFHRGIIESGSLLQVSTKDEAAQAAEAMLGRLGVSPKNLDSLATLPAQKIVDSLDRTFGLRYGPVVDGRSIPKQTWTPHAPDSSAGVALIIGNCKDESTLFSMGDPELFTLTWDSLRTREVKAGIPEQAADQIIGAYKRDFPAETPSDLYFRISADRGARRNAITQALAKYEQHDGDVYMYNFAWNTPLADGKVRAFHTAELPLAMRLVLNPEAEFLSRQIAGAWASFARSGSPNHKDLPQWSAYSPDSRMTMVFDAGQTRAVSAPVSDELRLLAPYPGGLL